MIQNMENYKSLTYGLSHVQTTDQWNKKCWSPIAYNFKEIGEKNIEGYGKMKLLKLGFFYGTFKFNIYVCGGIIVAIQWDVSAMWQSYCYVQLTYENKSLKEKKKFN